MEHKGKRKSNWSEREVSCMCSFVKEHRERLFGKAGHCSKKVEDRKRRCWDKCVEQLAQECGTSRTVEDVKKKWANMKVRANHYESNKRMTGGGEAPSQNPRYEAVLEAMARQARDGILGSQEEAGFSSEESQQDAAAETIFSAMVPSEPGIRCISPAQPPSNVPPHNISNPPQPSHTISQPPHTPPQVPPPQVSQTLPPAKQKVKKTLSPSQTDLDILEVERQRLEVEKENLQLRKEEVELIKELLSFVKQKFNNES